MQKMHQNKLYSVKKLPLYIKKLLSVRLKDLLFLVQYHISLKFLQTNLQSFFTSILLLTIVSLQKF